MHSVQLFKSSLAEICDWATYLRFCSEPPFSRKLTQKNGVVHIQVSDSFALPQERRLLSGRPPATSIELLSSVGLSLFIQQGFDHTSIEDIAEAAGISRRTFFRYFDSKADLVWGDFDSAVDQLRLTLLASPADLSTMNALRMAVIEFNRLPPEQTAAHRERIALILSVPALTARSTIRYQQWRTAVEEFAANRLELPMGHLVPVTIGHCALGAALAAHERWLRDEDADLELLLDQAFRWLATGFDFDSEASASLLQLAHEDDDDR